MTFLLQAQKIIMWNAWFLTKLIRDHDSKTSSFSQTTTTLHIQCCMSAVFRVMTSDQLCQEPSISHNKFLCLQQKCYPWCIFIWNLKGFCSTIFPSGGSLDPLKWGQNEAVKGEAEDFKSVTIEFYGSNIVYYDSFDAYKTNWAKPLEKWGVSTKRFRFQDLLLHIAKCL